MNNLKFINTYVLPIISQASKDDRQRDILSILFIVATFLSGASLIYIVGTIDDTLGYVVPLILLIILIPIAFYIFCKPKHIFIIKLIVLVVLSIFLIWFYQLQFLALLLIGLFIPMQFFYPIGGLGYYRIIQNLNYLEEIINLYNKKQIKKKRYQLVAMIAILIGSVFYSYAIQHIIPLNDLLGGALFGALTLIMWMYQGSSSSEVQLFKKSIVYLIFFIALVIANFKAESDVLKIPLLLFNIFFALDRIISLSKEAKDLIVSKSILYYNDHDDIKNSQLISNLIPVQYIEKVELEEEIVRQLIIRSRLKLEEEFLEVYNVYSKRDFKSYKHIVESYKYFMEFDESWLNDMDALYKKVKEIVEIPDQEIVIPQIYIEYAIILLRSNKYKESIDAFRRVFIYLDIQDLEMLRQAYVELEDTKNAEIIQKIIIKEKNNDQPLFSP